MPQLGEPRAEEDPEEEEDREELSLSQRHDFLMRTGLTIHLEILRPRTIIHHHH
jgi:hypothetical protein